MKKRIASMLALLMACAMVAILVCGCAKIAAKPEPTQAGVEAAPTAAPAEQTVAPQQVDDTPLVVASGPFFEKFSQFYADSAYDMEVAEAVGLAVMTTDRMGGIIYNAIEGETASYNGAEYLYTGPADISVSCDEATGITTYVIKLRDDIVFSDGTLVTADDLIFTYYVYLDPDYNGPATLYSYDIVGLRSYLMQTSDDIYDKYAAVADAVHGAGFDYTPDGGEAFTQEQYDYYYAELVSNWKADLQDTIDYVAVDYADSHAEEMVFKTAGEVRASDGLKTAFGMVMWGFGSMAEDGVFTDFTGKTYDANAGVYPTLDDFFAAAFEAYNGDAAAYCSVESAVGADIVAAAKGDFITRFGNADPEGAGGIPNISGITKLDEHTVQVQVNGYSASAVYSICGLIISPKDYYGDGTYDYDANNFGHPFGDLSAVQSKNTCPMGAGPYKFIKYENNTVCFEANELYFRGAPKIKHMQWVETPPDDVAVGIASGAVDIGEMTGSKESFDRIRGYNSNGELTGDVVATSRVYNPGYGYLGANADAVAVDGEPGSDASKNLRKAMMTVFSVYREMSVNSYYGDAATVIDYPISSASWAAPAPADEACETAFSADVDGNPIYTADMTQEQREAAAVQAALGYFEAAGFTVEDGRITGAPKGERADGKTYLEYEVIVPAGGKGDHFAFSLLTDAKAALASIGITLTIDDPADTNVLWNALDTGTQDFWILALQADVDPDMYQMYHSSNIAGRGGSDTNHYHLQSDNADALIIEAEAFDNLPDRKMLYRQILEEIMDWAVVLPTYQRQNCVTFSTKRVNTATLTPDITVYWAWMKEAEKLETVKAVE